MKRPRKAALASVSLTVNASSGNAMIDDARVVRTDIAASNGVMHVIDTVVLPR